MAQRLLSLYYTISGLPCIEDESMQAQIDAYTKSNRTGTSHAYTTNGMCSRPLPFLPTHSRVCPAWPSGDGSEMRALWLARSQLDERRADGPLPPTLGDDLGRRQQAGGRNRQEEGRYTAPALGTVARAMSLFSQRG